ncbi:MAG: sensor histidine kinase [Clostridia bacterium]
MNKSIRVLHISDSREDVENIHNEMWNWGFSVVSERVSTYEELKTELKTRVWDLIISDYAIGQFSFTEAISLISGMENELPLIVVSDDNDEKYMFEAIEKGCSDYILKNDFIRLRLSINRVLKESAVRSDHKKKMREYSEDNKRLLDTLDSIGDGVIITDKKGNIIMLNKVTQVCTGWMQQEALGKPLSTVFRIIDKTSRLPAENLYDKVLMEGKATGLKSNTVLVSKDCTERYVSANCAPIITGYNGFAGAILVFRDITRIKRIEDEIINEQRNLTAMFDAAPVGMLLFDQNAGIRKANSAIYYIAGKEPFKQSDNKRIGDIFKCPNRNNCAEGCGYCGECISCGLNIALQKACSSDKIIINSDVEYTVFTNEDNRKLWLRINSVPIIIDAEQHTLVVIDDITGLKQLQEELKGSNEELQNALKELQRTQNHLIQQEKLAGIGQLAAGVAHEINNPLGFVMSNFETLKNYVGKYKGALDAYRDLRGEMLDSGNKNIESKIKNINDFELKANIDFIAEDLEDLFKDTNEGLKRIGKIISGLRLFSRVDQQNDVAEYDLNEGIQNTLIVANNEIKYYADVEMNLQSIPIIHVNGGQINQVLLNLIVNAVHAIKSKGTGEMGLIKISTSCDDEFIYCSIEDNGIGITEDNLNKIFDPFFTTKSVGKGTGLGLSISYDIIVNKHDGELQVKSTKDVGSSFIIKIPIHE